MAYLVLIPAGIIIALASHAFYTERSRSWSKPTYKEAFITRVITGMGIFIFVAAVLSALGVI